VPTCLAIYCSVSSTIANSNLSIFPISLFQIWVQNYQIVEHRATNALDAHRRQNGYVMFGASCRVGRM
jgi:hypothetical protein